MLKRRWQIHWAIAVGMSSLISPPAIAQIVPDTSLGAEQSVLLPFNLIQGGAQRGESLFHSFTDFNIAEGDRADFDPPPGVTRIFARVTGQTRSEIFGTLGAYGSADLFLLNPNGVFFGPNARIDLPGSLIVSTADQFFFGNETFSARNPQTAPLLTIATPIGLQYGGNSGVIQVEAPALEVQPNQSLALLGGNVLVNGTYLAAPSGQIDLIAVKTGELTRQLNRWDATKATEFTDLSLGDSLSNRSFVEVRGEGGQMRLQGRNIAVQNSSLLAGVGFFAQPEATAGDVVITATDRISFQSSLILNDVPNVPSGNDDSIRIGNAGKIQITARSLILSENSYFQTSLNGTGSGGDINVNVDSASFSNSRLVSEVLFLGRGNSGNINLKTGSLLLTDGSRLITETTGQGKAGDINLQVRDEMRLRNSDINSRVGASGITDAKGIAGNILIQAGRIVLTGDSLLTASTLGLGDAGNIDIQVRDETLLDGSGISSKVEPFRTNAEGNTFSTNAEGNAGKINLQTGQLTVIDRSSAEVKGDPGEAFLDTSTGGRGDAAAITIAAREQITLDGGRISSELLENSIGDGKNITISAPIILLQRQANLSTFNLGDGQASDINIQAQQFSSNAAEIISSLGLAGRGSGGNISIRAQTVTLDDSSIQAVTAGQGKAGDVNIQNNDRTSLQRSRILTEVESRGQGAGGNIIIGTNFLTLMPDSRLSTSTQGNGKAGDIRVTALQAIDLIGSQAASDRQNNQNNTISSNEGLFANTDSASDAGEIILNTAQLIVRDGATISLSSSKTGIAGDLAVTANSLRLDRGNILSNTEFGQGGELTLTLRDPLFLSRNSSISTTAGRTTRGGNGGNINITASFIIANPNQNSDITANAFDGDGGNIKITTQRLFGIEFRDRPTDLTNDITASSDKGINGTVLINTSGIDPIQRAAELPVGFTPPPIAQGCQTNPRTSRFVNQGRGGIAPNPTDPIATAEIWQDLQPITPIMHQQAIVTTAPTQPFIEAQVAEKRANGRIAFVATGSRSLEQIPRHTVQHCP
jgi:filamentous hemagglutinin family protein